MTTGERIREARVKRKMTQQDLADALGCTRQAVGRYENEERICIGFYGIAKICKSLSVSADWLLGLTDEGGY